MKRLLPKIFSFILILCLLFISGCTKNYETSEESYTYNSRTYTVVINIAFSTNKSIEYTQDDLTEPQKQKLTDAFGDINIKDGELFDYSENHDQPPYYLTQSDDEFLTQAKKYLIDLGLMPKPEYITRTNKTTVSTLISSSSPLTSVTSEFSLGIAKSVDGIPLLNENLGINITFDTKGITRLIYGWGDVKVKTVSSDKELLSYQEIIKIYDAYITENVFSANLLDNLHCSQVYFYHENTFYPAWQIVEGNGDANPIYINAVTGEIIYSMI
ncbi:MAG: hypothetical protein A2Y17_07920 [Clostridiales bacterium GWF2_38_85]|nr:MAG: hypothetical protein A2Y17_07920 [Clostridiales bacterium GWF2_38_85]HBL84197.1 hypothetical protein [Clostridiales bacterium]